LRIQRIVGGFQGIVAGPDILAKLADPTLKGLV
jgi:hypothetical protein